MVGRVLTDAGRDDLVEHAQLLVSEVVTNALVHAATPIDVSMAATPDGVLVEIGDGSQHIPRPRNYAATASTGRGLALLDRTADAWGVVPGIRGKTVWFQLSSVEDDDEAGSGPGGADIDPLDRPNATVTPIRARADDIRVELLDVPLLLHAAWQQQAEGVLREYLLASMDLESEVDSLSEHAAATDALAVLAEHIPEPDIGIQPDELMSNAVDPRVSSPRVELMVPRGSVPHFEVLDTTLDAATTMALEGRLLSAMVQPEMRMVRRWLCTQVAEQSAGTAAPWPWPPPEALNPPPRREIAWDHAPVSDSSVPMIAADDMDLIRAVSRGALELLGYDDAEELVGQRLVTIIPGRYRQAHIAGFSMHLLTGRAPLLDRPVQVPALRRDDTEVTVELSVQPQRLPHGRSIFLATLREAPAPTGQ